MPDWLTHVLIGLIAVEILSLNYEWVKEGRIILLAGTILPDMGNFTMLIVELEESVKPFFEVLSTPLGFLVFAALLSYLFKKEWRKKGFLLLSLGGISHLIADTLIINLEGRIMLLFPFSLQKYSFNIFRQGEFVYPAIVLVITITVFLLMRIFKKHQKI